MQSAPSLAPVSPIAAAAVASVDTASLQPVREEERLAPHRVSNLVIHYRSIDFHVHSFVLRHHSAYFRAVLDALTPLSEVKTEEVDEEGSRK